MPRICHFSTQPVATRNQVLLPIAGGAVIAGISVLLMWNLKPVWVALLFLGGLACLPALLVKDVKASWLTVFLLILPLGLSKTLATQTRQADLLEAVGGTWGMNTPILQLTDLVLLILLGLWWLQRTTNRTPFYFPMISYLPLGYLLWATLGTWFAPYPSISFFELIREYKFYLFYLFVINNVDPKKMGKLIISLLLFSLLFQGVLTIAKYKSQNVENLFLSFGIGQAMPTDEEEDSEIYRFESVSENSAEDTKRGVGTLPHPTGTAMHLELILPLALTLFFVGVKSKGNGNAKDKWIYLFIFLVGAIALYTTFSRGGMLGFLFSIIVCFSVLALRGFLTKTFIVWTLCVAAMLTPLAASKMHSYLTTRPEYLTVHLEHLKIGIAMLEINPIMGVGLNNSTLFRLQFTPGGESEIERALPIHNHYLLGLLETGIVGFGLYCTFFILVIINAFRMTRSKNFYTATFSIAILSAFSALAIHTIADYAGGDILQTMFWFYAGLIVALRRSESDTQPASPAPQTARVDPAFVQLRAIRREASP